MPYTTKVELYPCVNNLRSELKVDLTRYPINTINLLSQRNDVCIECRDFETKGLCGIAFIGKQYDTIILNDRRTSTEQSFDCEHEPFGTKLRRNGVDIYSIQKLMGHKNTKVTTETYVHNEIEVLKKLWGCS